MRAAAFLLVVVACSGDPMPEPAWVTSPACEGAADDAVAKVRAVLAAPVAQRLDLARELALELSPAAIQCALLAIDTPESKRLAALLEHIAEARRD